MAALWPFLDVKVVQESLHLTPELKNTVYKAPIQQYMQRYGYPVTPCVATHDQPFGGEGCKKRGLGESCCQKQKRRWRRPRG